MAILDRRAVGVLVALVAGALAASAAWAQAGPPPATAAGAAEQAPLQTPRVAPRLRRLPAWRATGGPHGGLGYDVRHSFADPDLWYVTDAWAGLFISRDGGATWAAANRGITTRVGAGAADAIPVFSATVDPHDPRIVWVGTQNAGEIFRSTDGGSTWERRDAGIDQAIAPFLSFRGFTVDPRTSEIVYAMGEIASPGWSPDGGSLVGLAMDRTQGIVYRTDDSGLHWRELWRGDNLARYCWIDPRDPDLLYVSTGIFDREAANTDVAAGEAGGVGILRSRDGGATWSALGRERGLADLFVSSLYLNPEEPDVLLAAVGESDWAARPGHTSGVYLSEDGGDSWRRVLGGELFTVVEFCEADPEVAYAFSSEAAYRSGDRGRTWTRFARDGGSWGPPGVVAGFPIDAQCHPHEPLRVFVNNYNGGNFLSSDGGETWVEASRGYTGAQIRTVAAMTRDALYAGGRTGPFLSEDGGRSWRGLANPGEGVPGARLNEVTSITVDPADPEHLVLGTGDLGPLVSRSAGMRWDAAAGPGPALLDAVFTGWSDGLVLGAVAATECATNLPQTGAPVCDGPDKGLYASRDGGDSWQAVEDPSLHQRGAVAVAASARDGGWLLVSLATAGVRRSLDRGASWQEVEGLPQQLALTLERDPADEEVVWAGVQAGGLYRSQDGGATWEWRGLGLPPEATVAAVAIQPGEPRLHFAGEHATGVYLSRDSGASWTPYNRGLEHRTVNVLSIPPTGDVLYAGIEGAGVWVLPLEDMAE